ncbi:MAG: pyridoxal 5'-phosphate synthase glutaminase subunit PdxT [Sulfolobales archaeon]|nr:pyridoxal 5'-phosphate synthase glutaminase subunit PdxT [Sulfolobales archaeon]MCX8209247.1 pyridoxal 5'-phosphate synthase glutaminase subunit PdxT [Sulfolobales archaeon]MDW8010678.1 pyridoxal 5'-phosphate synthase glutaminase subunit PdxT [Sulfolobales archaeon]
MVRVGVVAVQGDFLEHVQALRELGGVEVVAVKSPRDLSGVDALVIPGGESTTIGSLMRVKGLDSAIIDLAESGLPIMGTCAGAILLAKRVADRVVGETGQPLLSLMDIAVVRNAFGRQRESFTTDIYVDGVGKVRAVFIRAPAIVDAWSEARVIAYVDHYSAGKMGAAAVERNLLAVTFHPELSGDTKMYEYLLSMTRR